MMLSRAQSNDYQSVQPIQCVSVRLATPRDSTVCARACVCDSPDDAREAVNCFQREVSSIPWRSCKQRLTYNVKQRTHPYCQCVFAHHYIHLLQCCCMSSIDIEIAPENKNRPTVNRHLSQFNLFIISLFICEI